MYIKIKFIVISMSCFFIALAATAALANESAAKLPSAFLPEPVYTFEPVAEGTFVVHDFILQNKGNDILNIIKFKSG